LDNWILCGTDAADPVILGWRHFLSGRAGERRFAMEVKLYVGNLPKSTSDDELKTLFAQAGSVTLAEVVKDRKSGEAKGFAFVTLADQATADKAISMFNGYSLGGNEIKVNVAKPKPA
jgi:nucleolin